MDCFFHVDMDAFYASIEQRDNPELRGKPVLVGGSADRRGVVAACSYEARKHGVHSALPMGAALRLCPDALVVPVRMERYQEVSSQIHAVFAHYSPEVQRISIDEAFLNMTGTSRLLGPPLEIARRIKDHVRSFTDLTISVGIGTSRFIAKLASDVDKPDGLFMVTAGEESKFVLDLELSDLWGLGKQTGRKLGHLGIETVSDLRLRSIEFLTAHFGDRGGPFLHDIARGKDPGIYTGERQGHSVSSERTYATDISDREELRLRLLELTEEVFLRTRREGWTGKTIQIKVRFSDFETHTHQRSLDHPVQDRDDLYTTAWNLFQERWNDSPVRLLGVGIIGMEEKPDTDQMELFTNEKNRRLDSALLEVQNRFGRRSVTRASLLPDPVTKKRD